MTGAGPTLTVGCVPVPLADATSYVTIYTSPVDDESPAKSGQYAWPYYDGFESSAGPDALSDGDLLTPDLLNANVGIEGFATLQRLRPHLESLLSGVPSDVDLADAADADIKLAAALFGVLDEQRTPGIRVTKLSKVLHRKRPRLIPLHDRFVRALYFPSPVAFVDDRPWSGYMAALMRAMQHDLASNRESWSKLAECGSTDGLQLTPLRALDIVAWNVGKRRS